MKKANKTKGAKSKEVAMQHMCKVMMDPDCLSKETEKILALPPALKKEIVAIYLGNAAGNAQTVARNRQINADRRMYC